MTNKNQNQNKIELSKDSDLFALLLKMIQLKHPELFKTFDCFSTYPIFQKHCQIFFNIIRKYIGLTHDQKNHCTKNINCFCQYSKIQKNDFHSKNYEVQIDINKNIHNCFLPIKYQNN